MLSETGIRRLTGFLFLFILATSALSGGLAPQLIGDAGQIGNNLLTIAADPVRYRIGITFDLVSHMAIIALASALYLTFNKFNSQLALFGTLWRVVEGVVMIFTEINNFVLLGFAQTYVGANSSEALYLEVAGQANVSMGNFGVTIGLAFLSLGALAYNVLFVTSKAGIPRPLGWWGILASILGIAGALLGLILPSLSIVLTIGIFIMMLYEIVLGIWLLH